MLNNFFFLESNSKQPLEIPNLTTMATLLKTTTVCQRSYRRILRSDENFGRISVVIHRENGFSATKTATTGEFIVKRNSRGSDTNGKINNSLSLGGWAAKLRLASAARRLPGRWYGGEAFGGGNNAVWPRKVRSYYYRV